ncbi:flagellar hook-basal body complex protein FliE [Persicimonas caeni]|jgi:flagellar hook-basal body complex protein FliE|uniref:Flagellar hook-basal body complex protein FliE n=1 Tax=Persicimonas caeni TaxID=2292766 RepID=A0A4Y6PSP5_PERCE|nr:flagellar hook-basal body complex protein FliE [Persicimonas caeni]QDG51328.1 flagellar hook-basal body complex protein FliE [Persicimonas caeni]QED32549.1 flagellar hook-basal body complex protein FliE [Persicimonas caeni]
MAINPIAHPDRIAAATQQTRVEKASPDKFTELLAEGIDKANQKVIEGDQQVERMVETQGANLHETMIALEKADIATRLTAKIGQKLVQAYKEVSRMQV